MSRDETRRTWDAEAPTFDDEPDHGLADPDTRAAWRALLRDHLPPPPARIADLGCGTGTLAVLLAQEGYEVSGLDLSPAMIMRARAKARAAGVAATFGVGDAGHPDLDGEAYDVVLSRHVLWALPDPVAALARWVGLLAPEGRLVLVEGRWHTGGGLTAEETAALVAGTGRTMTVQHLTDRVYWGREITDERYLLVSPGTRSP